MACFFGQLPLDRQGFGPGELSNALASALRPADAFDCPDVQGPSFFFGQISSPQYLACFSETRVLFGETCISRGFFCCWCSIRTVKA